VVAVGESESSGIESESVGVEGVELITSNGMMLGSPSPDVDSK